MTRSRRRSNDILTLFRFLYFVSRYLALGAELLQTSAQSDLSIKRMAVCLPFVKDAHEHIDCVFVLACLYCFDLLQGDDLPLSIVGMAPESKLAQEFTGT